MTQATPAHPGSTQPLALDRASRVLVMLSALAALALQTYLGARAWHPLQNVVIASLVLAVLLGRFAPRLGSWVVLLPAYSWPLILLLASNRIDPAYSAVWSAALIGLVIGASGAAAWSFPVGWRLPLALWALSIAVSWPIVIWREIDYTPALLDQYHLAVTFRGNPPPVESVWIAHMASTQLVGLLWMDGLFRAFRGADPRRFERAVVWPLASSAAVMIGLALYQMFVNIEFYNAGAFAALGRVSGAILDGNACGMVAALWAVGVLVLAVRSRRTPVVIGCVAAAAALGVVVWGSGSRTAFLALVVGSATGLVAFWRSSRRSRRTIVSAAVIVAVVVCAALAFRSRSGVVGPLARMGEFTSNGGLRSFADVTTQLWNRNAYGQVATAMFRTFPMTGTGVGTFPSLAIDYAYLFYRITLDPDNAQNWFRHQLVETGLLGSIGWIAWVGMLLWFLVRRAPTDGREVSTRTVKGMLVGLGLASCLGMPTLNPQLLMTFWALVFWAATLADATTDAGPDVRSPARWWVGVWLLAAIFAACTAYVGAERLRVPLRALRADWNYAYGFYNLEQPGSGHAYWWTGKKAVAVFPATERYLCLSFWVDHPDVRTRPVHVKIWRTSELIVDTDVSDSAPIVRYVKVPDGMARMMLETSVDRVWTPSASGSRDTRELGIAVAEWSFVADPPDGAVVIR